MREEYRGRKFVLTLLVLALATALVWFGKITPQDFRSVVMFVVGAYVAGNVGQKGLDWWLGGSQATPKL